MSKKIKFPWQYFISASKLIATILVTSSSFAENGPPYVYYTEGPSEIYIALAVTVMDGTCSINDHRRIFVDFGNSINIEDVNSGVYEQPLRYSVQCDGRKKNEMKIKVIGEGANFNRNILATDKAGLGIIFKMNGRAMNINPGVGYNFNFPTLPRITVAPISNNPMALQAGRFKATASLVIDYE